MGVLFYNHNWRDYRRGCASLYLYTSLATNFRSARKIAGTIGGSKTYKKVYDE